MERQKQRHQKTDKTRHMTQFSQMETWTDLVLWVYEAGQNGDAGADNDGRGC